MRALLGGIATALLLIAAAPASADVDRAFATRFQADVPGNVAIVGNANLSCTPAVDGSACDTARSNAPTSTSSTAINDYFAMSGVFGGDADPNVTLNSSSATLTLPPGAEVRFAGLYWAGTTATGISGSTPAPHPENENKVMFKVPGASAYTQVMATQVDTLSSSTFSGFYQSFLDVTGQVQQAGNGTYDVGDIQAASGQRAWAGWSLVVAYRDPAEPLRDLTIWDGFQSVGSGASVSIPVSGFKTPLTGTVKTDLGFVAWEGDRGITGDRGSITDTTPGHAGAAHQLSDAVNPATNLFNSSISRHGVETTTRSPSYSNTLGVDEDVFDVGSTLGNGATSASISLTSTGDVYAPGAVSFATQLYAPDVDQAMTVGDDNGGNVEPGDTLTYDITGNNGGGDAANSFAIADDIPANASYVPGSAAVLSGPSGATASYDTAAARANFALGTLAPAATYHVRFQATVNSVAAHGAPIDDSATASFTGATLGVADFVTSKASKTVTLIPADLSLTKTPNTRNARAGDTITYTIVVHNAGPGTAFNTRVIDTLPEGTSLAEGPPDCSASGRDVTCPLGTVAPGADVTLVLKVLVGPGVSGRIVNVARAVSSAPDPDSSNDSNDPDSVGVDIAGSVTPAGQGGDNGSGRGGQRRQW